MKKLYVLLLLCSGVLSAQPVITEPSPLVTCLADETGYAIFDLESKVAEILGTNDPAAYTATFHLTELDALANVNGLLNTSDYETQPTTVFVRITAVADPLSFAVTPLSLQKRTIGVTIALSNPWICNGQSGTATFTAIGGVAPYTFYYYKNNSPFSITSETNSISIPYESADYMISGNISIQYVADAICYVSTYAMAQYKVIEPGRANSNMLVYEEDSDGIAVFDLDSNKKLVSGYDPDVTVTFHKTAENAQLGLDPITDTENYTNTTNPEYLYARMVSNTYGCSAYTNFRLDVADSDYVFIPDDGLKEKLIDDGYDTNGDFEIQFSEAEAVTELILDNLSVFSLDGIKYFPNLTVLHANDVGQGIDLEGLAHLEEVVISGSGVHSINLNGLINLKNLHLSNNYLKNIDLTGLTNLENLNIESNPLQKIDLTGLSHLKSIIVGSQLTELDLSVAPMLESVEIFSGEYLHEVNLTGLSSLKYFHSESTALTSIDLTDLTSLETLSLNYNMFETLTIPALENLKYLYCRGNQLTQLEIPALQLVELDVNYNKLTSIDLSALTQLEVVDLGRNEIGQLNVATLKNLKQLNCNKNHITTLDLSENKNLELAAVADNPIVTLFMKNGVSELVDFYNYDYPTLQYVCADEEQIGALEALFNNLGNTVSVNSYCTVPPGGDYNIVQGTARFDVANDGCTVSDPGLIFTKINISDGTGISSVISNYNGKYKAFTAAGTYTIAPVFENDLFTFAAVPDITFPEANYSEETQDFCITSNGISPDAEIVVVPITPARPGFDAVYHLIIKNKGNQVLSGIVNFSYSEELMEFIASEPVADIEAPGLLTFNYEDLQPFETRTLVIKYNINAPTATPAVNIDDILIYNAAIVHNSADDITPLDNAYQLNQTVVGSFDPNDKYCVEGSNVNPIHIGEFLHYVINFENTGTYPAETIVVKDMIDDTKFDLSSLQLLSTSHEVMAKITGNKAEFIFENINLQPNEHGNVVFKIKTKETLTEGDMVSNSADIFFDYNFPIHTNKAETTFQLLGIKEYFEDTSIVLYPNPTADVLNITADSELSSVQLYDIQGRLLQAKPVNSNQMKLDISGQQSEIYFVKVISAKGQKIEKIFKK